VLATGSRVNVEINARNYPSLPLRKNDLQEQRGDAKGRLVSPTVLLDDFSHGHDDIADIALRHVRING
jgi:hypothetical protein